MEYFRTPEGKISAGFALNSGKLLGQYLERAQQLSPNERYDATITICVLQALLTSCAELLQSLTRIRKGPWSEPLLDIPHQWGLDRRFVVKNTFPGLLTYERFVEHLRNALCHPTSPDKSPGLPSTGYSTIPQSSGMVGAFRFIDSPWIDRGAFYSSYKNKKRKSVDTALEKFAKRYPENDLGVSSDERGYFFVTQDGRPYVPLFVAEIPLSGLVAVALELANYLAQPIDDSWDKTSVKSLVA